MRILQSRELPHVQHFNEGHLCRFRRATHVGPYIVSTVGELVRVGATKMVPLDGGRNDAFYETLVFHATKTKPGDGAHRCCGVRIRTGTLGRPLITVYLSSAGAAQLMHDQAVRQAAGEGFRRGMRYPW
jgi:hypothetical protein